MPHAAKILKKKKANKIVTTYVLDISVGARPGQFVNMWIPGHDEKPFSVAYDDGKYLTLAIAAVGPFTQFLSHMNVGDKVGIRGPYGVANRIPKNCHVATVGGGYGAAPLLFFAKEAVKNGCKVDFIVGARNKELLLYTKEVSQTKGVTLHVATDDGSFGHKGYCTEILSELVKKKKIKFVAVCGPELMEEAAYKILVKHKIDADISIERYMKCGFSRIRKRSRRNG